MKKIQPLCSCPSTRGIHTLLHLSVLEWRDPLLFHPQVFHFSNKIGTPSKFQTSSPSSQPAFCCQSSDFSDSSSSILFAEVLERRNGLLFLQFVVIISIFISFLRWNLIILLSTSFLMPLLSLVLWVYGQGFAVFTIGFMNLGLIGAAPVLGCYI